MNTNELTRTEISPTKAQTQSQQRYNKPAYEVVSKDDHYIVRVFTPGAAKNSVQVTHEKGTLSIIAERQPHQGSNWKPLLREISDGGFRLQLQLNAAIDDQGITAQLENGVVNVTLPIAEEAKPRKIKVR